MKFTLSLLALVSLPVFATGLPKGVKWQCQKQIVGTINELGVVLREDWKKNYHDGQPSFKAATTKVSQWVLAEKQLDRDVLIYMTPEQKSVYTYDSESCQPKLEVTALQPAKRNVASGEYFDDHSLSELLKKHPNTIIYIWSPYMALSLKGVAELKVAASETGLPITYIMDPMASESDAVNAAKKYELPEGSLKRADSMELSMRNALIHYPTLIVAKDGKLCKKLQRGYRPAETWRAIIANIYGGCK